MLNQYHTETLKLSLVLFDEIEKASDALWNLLLGILDKGTLTLGDNRKVDFSRSMIFMASNLGAVEMSDLVKPKLGFNAYHDRKCADGEIDAGLSSKMERSALAAARRRFPRARPLFAPRSLFGAVTAGSLVRLDSSLPRKVRA